MIQNRKFKIWFISFAVVLFVFLLYRIFGNIGIIKISKPAYQSAGSDVNGFDNDANAGQVGQARLEYVERARFETVDPKTRKLKRVVGFEKVLHKSGDEWVLDKPYMNIFQENLRCDITADTGTVELENVEGADPSPKQAILKGNVIVHVLGQGKRSDSYIYLNEVAFDSDRSMLWSNNDVNFVSVDADLMGKGLEIVYNNATNRLEYFKIKQIEFLNIRSLPETIADANDASPEISKTPKQPKPAAIAAVPSESGAGGAAAAEKEDNYQCLFRDNVKIEYKEEVVLADEISITNLLWSQAQSADQQQQPPQAGTQTTASTETSAVKTEEIKQLTQQRKPIVATVKCDGPMIIKPVASGDYDEVKPAEFKGFYQLGSDMFYWLGQRNVLISQKINYDIATETASAEGKVELVFYPQIKAPKGRGKTPFIISAKQGAQFVVPDKEAAFFGDVKGAFIKQADLYDEENVFYGSKLVATLNGEKGRGDLMNSSDISHITVFGPNVRLESVRTLDKTKLSHVRLKSERIDYDRASEDIIAVGKGKIEYSNTAKNVSKSSGQKSLDKPCFALVEGFTKLVWDTNSMHVSASSEKTAGIHIGYVPIIETGYGPRITIDTRQVDIDYFEPTPGNSQLKKLKAAGGIVYYEQGRYEFAGKELNYNAAEDFMTVSGTPEMPCMLNGVFADAIEYNLKTGSASAVLGGGVGIMPVRE
jgi:lipopolysaccharide export system protein LptA